MFNVHVPGSPLARTFRMAADPEAARDVLGRHLFQDNDIRSLKILKAWPRLSEMFIFLYEITDETGVDWAVAFLFPPGSSLLRPSCPSRASYVPEWNAYVQRFPNDYRMPYLRKAAVPFRARNIIEPVLAGTESGWRGFCLRSVKPLSYWPSRKCLLKYKGDLGENPSAHFYVKVFLENTAASLLDIHRALRAAGLDGRHGLEVPAPIGYCRELRAALIAPAAGKTVLEFLDSPQATQSSAEAGRLLCAFHRSSTGLPLPVQGPDEEFGILKSWVSAIELIEFQGMSKVRSLLCRLEGKMDAARRPIYLGHGDFYDKQLLFDENIITVLDMDMACLAPAERDAGNFLAHLELRGLENTGRADQYVRLGRSFKDAYASGGGVLADPALAWYRASAFLRLACRATIQPGEDAHFEPLIRLAERDINLV
jgi:aminoglycoside phosphotransferase (APT) family kinase protein